MTYSKLLFGFLSLVALSYSAPREASLFAADDPVDPDEAILREAKIGADDASLIDFLRQEVKANAEPPEIKRFIALLASEKFAEREQAAEKLIAVGFAATPFLRRALKDDNEEIARRAKACIEMINQKLALPRAAVRLVARRKPADAVEAVLGYLPKVADEKGEEEVWYCLEALAVRDGKVDPALTAALKDAAPSRRAVAACILGRLGDREQRAAVTKLLKDPDPEVRLRTAQGLLAVKEKAVIPTLLELLDADSTAISWQAEELLHWATAGKGPKVTVGSGSTKRKKDCRNAWETWWREKGDKVDPADFGKTCNRPGLMLVLELESVYRGADFQGTRSLLHLYGCDGRLRWQLDDAPPIWDFQPLPGPRLLLVEGKSGEAVTERDLQGKVLWKKDFDAKMHPFTCQRLPNGNTFILGNGQLIEVDGDGKEVFHHELPRETASLTLHAQKLENGHILCVTDGGIVREFDTGTGKELHSFRPEVEKPHERQAAILNDGHFLLPAEDPDEIVETDAAGRKVRANKWPFFECAARLKNGHTLVAQRSDRTGRVFEVDRAGKKVHETDCTGTPKRIRVCLGLVRFGFDDAGTSTP